MLEVYQQTNGFKLCKKIYNMYIIPYPHWYHKIAIKFHMLEIECLHFLCNFVTLTYTLSNWFKWYTKKVNCFWRVPWNCRRMRLLKYWEKCDLLTEHLQKSKNTFKNILAGWPKLQLQLHNLHLKSFTFQLSSHLREVIKYAVAFIKPTIKLNGLLVHR